MLDRKEIDIEIARLEYTESSYPNYAKLADLYTIRDQMEKGVERTVCDALRIDANLPKKTLSQYGNSEFLEAVSGKPVESVWAVIDDLMDTLRVANPRVYNGVMRKIGGL